MYLNQLDNNPINKKIKLPKDSVPLSVSEKLIKEEIRRINEHAEEIEKLKDQIKKSNAQHKK